MLELCLATRPRGRDLRSSSGRGSPRRRPRSRATSSNVCWSTGRGDHADARAGRPGGWEVYRDQRAASPATGGPVRAGRAGASASRRARMRRIVAWVQRRPVPGERVASDTERRQGWLGHVSGLLGDRGHRPSTDQHGGGSQGKNADQQAPSPAPSTRVGNRGETAEQVRGFGCAQHRGRGPEGSGRAGADVAPDPRSAT